MGPFVKEFFKRQSGAVDNFQGVFHEAYMSGLEEDFLGVKKGVVTKKI